MKKLNNLRKQLPSNAKLNPIEFNRIKGGADKSNRDRPSREKSNNSNEKGNAFTYGHSNNGG